MRKMIALYGKDPALETMLISQLGDDFSLISVESDERTTDFLNQYADWIDGILFNYHQCRSTVWPLAKHIIETNARAILAVVVRKEDLPEIKAVKRIPKRVLILVEPLDPAQVFAAFRHKLGR